MTVTYLYKCRRCGEIEREKVSAPSMDDMKARKLMIFSLNDMGITNSEDYPLAPLAFSTHRCDGKSGSGVTDLIGYEPES